MKLPVKLPAPLNPRRGESGIFRLTYFNFSLWAPIVVAAIFLILPASITQPNNLQRLFAPVANMVAAPVQTSKEAIATLSQWWGTVEQNKQLKQRVIALEAMNLNTKALEAENARLANLLNLKSPQWVFQVSGMVTASSGGAFSRSIMVSTGKVDGVQKWDAVLAANGIIGRVVEVFDKSSLVLLVTDFSSKIPVMAQDGSFGAIMSGDNSPFPFLDFLEPSNAKLAAGTRLVTSGHGGHFAPQMQVGTITEQGRVKLTASVDTWVTIKRYQRK